MDMRHGLLGHLSDQSQGTFPDAMATGRMQSHMGMSHMHPPTPPVFMRGDNFTKMRALKENSSLNKMHSIIFILQNANIQCCNTDDSLSMTVQQHCPIIAKEQNCD